ncbi:MAG: translational GTPase TypA [Candidatus Pacebacteria bacterium]|nr:translational GTPase TypA [Candidatus Paceibacterota bacterium]
MADIRNIAIIAHVDHGKTTLTDGLLKFTGAVDETASSMDSNDLEKERGITIYSKNCSLNYKGVKINIVDTPGHADFGSEVERVLRSIDTVLLLVDAQEGPMPQTRFVLKKSLELGLKPIVVVNKIDKPAADPARCHEQVLELFLELGASDEQIDFKTVYAIGRQGIAKRELTDDSKDLSPLLDMILEIVPSATRDVNAPAVAQAFNLAYDSFLGRLAIARVYDGTIKDGTTVFVKHGDTTRTAKITKLFSFIGQKREAVSELVSGDIGIIAGISDIYIGETIAGNDSVTPLPTISIDEPTITLSFLVNDSPFAGRDGKFVTSRQIRERLERELEVNVGLRVDFDSEATFQVSGRGELHIAVLLEQMRREGFEMQVSQPRVIIKEIDGEKCEPFEEATIDVPNEFSGSVIETLTKRRGLLTHMQEKNGITRILVEIPTRGLLGYRNQFVIDTKGEGILAARVIGFRPYAGEIKKKEVGAMISMVTGAAAGFSIWNLQDRGVMYIVHNTEVYEGMVVGNTSKGEEMQVNPIKGKALSNVRASGRDEAMYLNPAWELTIERGLEVMNDDEYLEITPHFVRLRKKYLTDIDRARAGRSS